jgi:hypothetical protein
MNTRPLLLALSITAVLALAAPAPLRAQDATPAASAAPVWVAKSNAYAQILVRAQGPFQPEQLSFLGIPGYDDQVFDFGPGYQQRYRAAMQRAKAELLAKSAGETDPDVRQDLAILAKAADDAIEASAVNERMVRPFADVGQTVFQGLQGLLSDQVPPERRALALRVVAEGVEDEEQAKLLRLLRCDVLQGYLLGRPLAAADFARQLLAPFQAPA